MPGRKPMRGKKRSLKGKNLKYLCLRVEPDVHDKLAELAGQSSLSEMAERMVRHYYRSAVDKHSNPK